LAASTESDRAKGHSGAAILAIDGPGGAGKSTVTRRLAEHLGVPRLDTGAIYRAVTAGVLRAGVDPADSAGCTAVAERARVRFSGDRVLLDDDDVTKEIRGPRVTAAVSRVSAHGGVRRALVGQQRAVADGGTWIVEGRDIGTVVFPDAVLKVFLTASARERARRRAAELGETDVEAVESEMRRRDHEDSTRADSPLRAAADAVAIDTTEMDANEVVEHIAALWRRRMRGTRARAEQG